jgi:hypothetical protein
MAIPQIEIEDFNYTLPEDRIRVIPLEDRSAAKLLVYQNGEITDTVFSELPNFLKEGDLLISNNSKVIPARIVFQKESGAFIEIMCLAPFGVSYTEAFSSHDSVAFTAYIGNSKRWKEGKLEMKIMWNNSTESVFIERKGIEKDAFVVEFSWKFNAVFRSDRGNRTSTSATLLSAQTRCERQGSIPDSIRENRGLCCGSYCRIALHQCGTSSYSKCWSASKGGVSARRRRNLQTRVCRSHRRS